MRSDRQGFIYFIQQSGTHGEWFAPSSKLRDIIGPLAGLVNDDAPELALAGFTSPVPSVGLEELRMWLAVHGKTLDSAHEVLRQSSAVYAQNIARKNIPPPPWTAEEYERETGIPVWAWAFDLDRSGAAVALAAAMGRSLLLTGAPVATQEHATASQEPGPLDSIPSRLAYARAMSGIAASKLGPVASRRTG